MGTLLKKLWSFCGHISNVETLIGLLVALFGGWKAAMKASPEDWVPYALFVGGTIVGFFLLGPLRFVVHMQLGASGISPRLTSRHMMAKKSR